MKKTNIIISILLMLISLTGCKPNQVKTDN